jgi:hypothetical protein
MVLFGGVALAQLPAIHIVGPEPYHYPTIQSAIDEADDGDVVKVLDGTYTENIDFKGKAIVVRSNDNSPEDTFIDGGMNGPCVRFVNSEGRDSVLKGFSIINGSGEYWVDSGIKARSVGGGIYGYLVGPTIKNCDIYDNELLEIWTGSPPVWTSEGGGIYIGTYHSSSMSSDNDNAFPYIKNCNVYNNRSGSHYGGICIHGASDVEIYDCEIYENWLIDPDWYNYSGLAFYLTSLTENGGQTIRVERNKFYNNDADEGETSAYQVGVVKISCDGSNVNEDASLYFINNIIADNQRLGGLSSIYFENVYIINNTFYDETYEYGGELLHFTGPPVSGYSDLFIYNNIIWCVNGTGGGYYPVHVVDRVDCEFDYNCIKGGSGDIDDDTTGAGSVNYGNHNTTSNPYLDDPGPTGYDYHLTGSSTNCIDEGIDTYAPDDDFEGDERPYNSDYDIGADEYTG